MTEVFRINAPQVAAEIIEDDAVIINLESGLYYSLDGAGKDIWFCVENFRSIAETVDFLLERYEATQEEIETSVDQLVNELRQEALIVTADPPQSTEPLAVEAGDKKPFEIPTLKKYTDMQDLLLLDPIHDVDESGWPNQSTE